MATKSEQYLTVAAARVVAELKNETGQSQKLLMSAGIMALRRLGDEELARYVGQAMLTVELDAIPSEINRLWKCLTGEQQEEFLIRRKSPVGSGDTEGPESVKDKERAIIAEALEKVRAISKQTDKLLKQAQQGKPLTVAQAKRVQAVVKEHEAVLQGRSVPHKKSARGKSG